ncbi:helix-turn-helix domain-containing protein [Thermogemmatispora onikobensis]|uniref:helix-turn-helix domain-containing protein n=1 Tax=Thermogemmatispora onikobensis TaxID=732234 RepID=UPI0008538807|nr:helix-turn-helix domain-containing protein [Thermogemmatispora onikobensis]
MSAPNDPWWVKMGLPAFEAGPDGYPRPGQVTRYYRQQMVKACGWFWSQKDLALALGLSEITVRKMEATDMGFDSISRRRAVARLLNIPPVLFALAAHPDDSALVGPQHDPATFFILHGSPLFTDSNLPDWQSAGHFVQEAWIHHHQTSARPDLARLHCLLNDLYRQLPFTMGPERTSALQLLTSAHMLYSTALRDLQCFEPALQQATKALHWAHQSNAYDAMAAVYFWVGLTFLDANDPKQALKYFEKSKVLQSQAPASLKAALLLHYGVARALTARSEQERRSALAPFDRAASLIRSGQTQEDPFFVKADVDRYHVDRARALLSLGRPREALAELEQRRPASELRRRSIYAIILEAEGQFQCGELEQAAYLLKQCLPHARGLHSFLNMQRIQALYKRLKTSPAAHTQAIVELGNQLGTDFPG